MSYTLDHWDQGIDAALRGDFKTIKVLVDQGFAINFVHPASKETLLLAYCNEIYLVEQENPFLVAQYKYKMLEHLINLGAEASASVSSDHPIGQPIWYCDEPMIEILLKAGTDINALEGRSDHESMYDTAKYAYLRAVNLPQTGINMLLKLANDETEDEWLESITTMAAEANLHMMPSHLRLLRRYGAKSYRELQAEKHLYESA